MEQKHIAIVGSTGSTGKEVVRIALEQNYKVTVIVRDPNKVSPQNGQFIMKGDVTDLKSLETAFKGVDFVISCFGPSNHKKVGNLMSLGAINLVKACEKNNVKRFIFMSGFVQSAGKDFFYPKYWLFTGFLIKLMRLYFNESFKDKIIAEAAVENSKLKWILIRASGLSDTTPTGTYSAGFKTHVSPFKTLPFADCARCLVDAIENDIWTKQIINVGKS